jgi:hypothetical protein
METEQNREIDVQLAEYKVLRSEIVYYIQRMDQTVTLYITAVFGLLAFCLRPGSHFDAEYMEYIKANPPLIALVLLIPILNSILLTRIAFLFVTMLTLARYVNAVITPRLSALIRYPVLCWDRADLGDGKGRMTFLRSLAQWQSAALAEGISMSILLTIRSSVGCNVVLILLYIIGWLGLFSSIAAFVVAIRSGRQFHVKNARVDGL